MAHRAGVCSTSSACATEAPSWTRSRRCTFREQQRLWSAVLQGQRCCRRRMQVLAVAAEKTGFVHKVHKHSSPNHMIDWLLGQGMGEQHVKVKQVELYGNHLDVTVADRPLKEGDLALRIPEHLVITLDRVFEDQALAELLTSNKLSELACLTLYLMYEKKNGPKSIWYEYIRELDRVRGRGQLGAKTPLLWDEGQAANLLTGSPLLEEIGARLKGIEREYEELDTVWFMAGSLFKNYPYDIPTEAFSLELFKQAFAAVQASVVHLQGVPNSRRFALVPLGPPLLSYSSTSKAMLQYNPEAREVQLRTDRPYARGEPVFAWCGPQPNSRLLLNYGIVDEDNPYDKLAVTVTLPTADPLFQLKRNLLQRHALSTMQSFQLQRDAGLPDKLLPYLRFAHCNDEASLRRAAEFEGPVNAENERTALGQLSDYLLGRLARYRTTIEEDVATIYDPCSGPRETVAARLLRIEKSILVGALERVDGQLSTVQGESEDSGGRCVAVRLK